LFARVPTIAVKFSCYSSYLHHAMGRKVPTKACEREHVVVVVLMLWWIWIVIKWDGVQCENWGETIIRPKDLAHKLLLSTKKTEPLALLLSGGVCQPRWGGN
jgi:hypothetical protein